jgi:hypothetical protein
LFNRAIVLRNRSDRAGMVTTGHDVSGRQPRPVAKAWQRLVVIFCLLVVIQDAHYAWVASGIPVTGSMGAGIDSARCGPDHFCPLLGVGPNSPAERAGIAAGDRVKADKYWEMYRIPNAGEELGLTVRGAGGERHVTLRLEPGQFYSGMYILTAAFLAILALTAALIAARDGKRRTTLLLASAMACFALPGNYPRAWQNTPILFEFFFVVLTFLLTGAPVLLAAAMASYRQDVTGSLPTWVRLAFWPIAALTLAGTTLGIFIAMNAAPALGISDGLSLVSIIWALASLFPAAVLIVRWARIPPVARTRYAFMAAASAALCVMAWIDPVIMLTTNNYTEASWPVVVQMVSLSLAAFLFAYAILRHRAIDLGFAVNRTLVYSVLSGILVAIFGLAERFSDALVPEGAHRAGLLVQAGIALLIFAAFHRLRDAVEHGVERIFFSRWREYERRMTAFIYRSSFVTRPAKLIEQSIEEIGRYTDGADVAIYLAANGTYRLSGGGIDGLPRRIDQDIPAVVALRADRALQRNGLGAAALLLPMLQRGELLGFIALGPKRDGTNYRPDEEKLLSDAAQAVGLDLHALRIDELERENRRLLAKAALGAAH